MAEARVRVTEPPEKLSGILGAIEDVAGRDAAARFSLRYGGGQFHVPAPDRMRDDHPLMSLELDPALAVAERYRGDVVYVPLARKLVSKYLFEHGSSVDAVAGRLGITKKSAARYKRQVS